MLETEPKAEGNLRKAIFETVLIVSLEDRHWTDQGIALGLLDVEDADPSEPRQARLVVRPLCSHGSKDRQRLFAASDVATERLPGSIASDLGGLRALHGDQEHIARAVAVEAGLMGEIGGPALGASEIVDLGLERIEQVASIRARCWSRRRRHGPQRSSREDRWLDLSGGGDSAEMPPGAPVRGRCPPLRRHPPP